MRWRIALPLTVALLGLPLAAQGVFATGNLDCAIDDKQVNFELFALTGGAGGIVQVNQGSIEIKVTARGCGRNVRSNSRTSSSNGSTARSCGSGSALRTRRTSRSPA